MGHGHLMTSDRHPVGGVRPGVDEAEAGSPPGGHLDGRPILRRSTVDEVEGVGHITCVTPQEVRAGHRHRATAHVVHAAHVAHRGQPVEDLLGRVAVDPVEPVIEDHHLIDVVVAGSVLLLDDQRRVEPAIQLQAHVRMEPVGTRVGNDELIVEAAVGSDDRLGEVGDAVHVVSDGEAMPVDRRVLRELVAQLDPEGVSLADPHLLAGDEIAVGPGCDLTRPEGERGRGGDQIDRRDLSGPPSRPVCPCHL